MQSHRRLFAILGDLGGHPSSTLTEIASRVELPKPTVLRFLRSLEGDAWVTRTPKGGYALGPSILGLAGQYLSLDSVIVAASPAMMRLRDTLGETATLSRASGATRICVQEFPSTQPLRLVLGLGRQGPLHAGASGLILLAYMPAAARNEILSAPLEKLTERTIASAEALELECERIRAQGWAITRGQRTAGAAAMCVPIEDPAAEWGVSALGVYGPDVRCRTIEDEHRWLAALRECATEIENVALAGSRPG
jgi:IclR family acetate operon transcriptional repressor